MDCGKNRAGRILSGAPDGCKETGNMKDLEKIINGIEHVDQKSMDEAWKCWDT